jgi:hypothetical protein
MKLLDGQAGEDQGSEERNLYSSVLPHIAAAFSDMRKCPVTLILLAKCMCTLVCHENDKKNRIILIQENVVQTLAFYLDYYDYDDKFVLCCLELFHYILPEIKLKIVECLYGEETKLIQKLRRFLEDSRVQGTYYSQRVCLILNCNLN